MVNGIINGNNGIVIRNGRWVMLCGDSEVVIRYLGGNDKDIGPAVGQSTTGPKEGKRHEHQRDAQQANG